MTEISRRKFIQLTVLGSAAGASLLADGCRDERIYRQEVTGRYGGESNIVQPYVNQPDGLEDGVPQYFATACGMCPAGCGLMIRTMGGRAVKVEGNPAHPVSGGKTCARGQAAVQHLYNPDRLRFPKIRGSRQQVLSDTDWEVAMGRLQRGMAGMRSAILVDAMTIGRSPSLMSAVGEFAASVGAKLFQYSLLDDSPWRAAAQSVYGRDQIPAYRIDQADCMVAFGANFLEAWPSPVYYGRLFGEFRQGERRAQGQHGKFYYIGPRMSMTAAKADRWIPCNPGSEGSVAAGLLSLLSATAGVTPEEASAESGVSVADLQMLATALRSAGPRALAIAGDGLIGQPNAVRDIEIVESINAQTGSICVGFGDAALPLPALNGGLSHLAQIDSLTAGIKSGAFRSVLILGQPNPVFTLPRTYGFADALDRTSFVAAITPFEDETTAHADLVLPARSFLESWNDTIPLIVPPGERMATLRQPVIDPGYVRSHNVENQVSPTPWMDTRETADVLIDLANRLGKPLTVGADARDVTRRAWATIAQANLNAASTDDDPAWVAALSKGGYWSGTAPGSAKTVRPHVAGLNGARVRPPSPNSGGAKEEEYTLHLFPHLYWTDGRHSNLNWLQEIPDPMTSAVWNMWVEINLQTAHKLGIRTGDLLRLSTAQGYMDAHAVPSPGIHPRVLAVPIGNGHAPGTYGQNPRGNNPLVILDSTAEAATGALAWNATAVKLTKIRDAVPGYHANLNTLVLAQDRPGGQEPEAVKNLIHTTAKEWKTAQPVSGQPQAEGSIFNRSPGVKQPGE